MAYTGFGSAVSLLSQYGILMAIAKLGTPTAMGQYTFAQALTAPIMIFWQLQLRQLQVTDAKQEVHFTDYFSLRLVCTVLALVTVVIVAAGLGYRGALLALTLLVAAAKAIESTADVLHGRLQRLERMDLVARGLVCRGVIGLAAVIVALAAGRGILGATVALAVAWLGVLLLVDVPLLHRVGHGDSDCAGGPR